MKNMLLGIAILLFANLFGNTGHFFWLSILLGIGGLALTLLGHNQMQAKDERGKKEI